MFFVEVCAYFTSVVTSHGYFLGINCVTSLIMSPIYNLESVFTGVEHVSTPQSTSHISKGIASSMLHSPIISSVSNSFKSG